MNRKFFVNLFIAMIVILTIGFSAKFAFGLNAYYDYVDYNVNSYSTKDIDELIESLDNRQYYAHTLAEAARQLNWTETSSAIQDAKTEWHNAQIAKEYYQKELETREKKLAETEKTKWDKKRAEYPVATEIWLSLKANGYNDYVCAGIIGNMMSEAGGQTLNIQPYPHNNNYYGICQWSKRYYKEVIGQDLAGQCEFLKKDLPNQLDTYGYLYKKGFNYQSFLKMSNEREVAKAYLYCYGRGNHGSCSIRQNNATTAYNYFVNN